MEETQVPSCSGVQASNFMQEANCRSLHEGFARWSDMSEISLNIGKDNTDVSPGLSDVGENSQISEDLWSSKASGTTFMKPRRLRHRSVMRRFHFSSGDDPRNSADSLFAPEKFRLVPKYVLLARRKNAELYAIFVDYFFERKKWPSFACIPQDFQDVCKASGIGPEAYEDMPGFAPEWVFHLRLMDYDLFWNVIHKFFQEKKFPSWNALPEVCTQWFRALKLGEYDYPSTSMVEKLPKMIKKRFKIFMERRLHLTEREFSNVPDLGVSL